jgi:hypothetical protein
MPIKPIYQGKKIMCYVDEVERWKISWALVDDKPDKLLDILHATNRDLYPIIKHHQYLIGVIGNKREIFQCNETREILLKVDYGL